MQKRNWPERLGQLSDQNIGKHRNEITIKCAPPGNRTRVARMGILHDTTTLAALDLNLEKFIEVVFATFRVTICYLGRAEPASGKSEGKMTLKRLKMRKLCTAERTISIMKKKRAAHPIFFVGVTLTIIFYLGLTGC